MSRLFGAIAAAVSLLVSGIAIGVLGTLLVINQRRGFEPPPFGPPPFGMPGGDRHGPGGPPGLPPGGPGHWPPPPLALEIDRRLELTETQREQFRAILDEGRRVGDTLRRELRPKLDQKAASVRAKLEAILTPQQRERWDALRRESPNRLDRFLIDGPPPPPPGSFDDRGPPPPPPDDRDPPPPR